ncbi:uncharacterized protein [Anoplolepis gracilipes]|uniref:uncharacterized protein n=1 Tax=Anoplolepis gracilipes TaxID=354296 RepID=UPI003B9FFDB7
MPQSLMVGSHKTLKRNEFSYLIAASYKVDVSFLLLLKLTFVVAYACGTGISYAIISLVPHIMNVILPLNTSHPVKLIWPAYYFVDEEKYYYYIVLDMLIILVVCLAAVIAHDSMFFIYTEHLCGLFAVIGFRFEYLLYKRDIAKKSLIDCPNDIYHKHIVFSIHVHRKTMELAKLMENIFSISLAIQLIVNTVAVSISLLQFPRTKIDKL